MNPHLMSPILGKLWTVVQQTGERTSDEEDVLHAYVSDGAPEEAQVNDAEEPRRDRPELTKSQRKLDEAELVPHDLPAGPYEAYGARQAVTATWSTDFPTNRRRTDRTNIMRERSGVRGRARNVTSEVMRSSSLSPTR